MMIQSLLWVVAVSAMPLVEMSRAKYGEHLRKKFEIKDL